MFLGGSAHATRSGGRLLEQFVILGADASAAAAGGETGVPAAQLYCFPPHLQQPLDASLPLFCFPEGLRVRRLKRTASNSRVNEVRYSNLRKLEAPNASFTFLLTGQDLVMYGVCVLSDELVDEPPSVCAANNTSNNNSNSTVEGRVRAGSVRQSMLPGAPPLYACAPRCYCLVSRFPFFKLHFDFIYMLLAKDRHVRMAGGGPHDVEQLLRGYWETVIPDQGSELSFKLPGDVHEFSFVLPGRDQDSLLTEWCGRTVLNLGLEGLLTLVAALVQEYRVIVQAEHLGTLTSFVMGLIPLLKPLVWQGALVPILPVAMAEALEAPVPFVFGIHRLDEMPSAQQLDKTETVFVNVDTKVVRAPENMQRLPNEEMLKKALLQMPGMRGNSAKQLLFSALGSPPAARLLLSNSAQAPNQATPAQGYGAVAECVTEIVRRAEELAAGRVADWDGGDDCVRSALDRVAKARERPFWSRFLCTQQWAAHLGARVSAKEAEEKLRREKTQKALDLQRASCAKRAETAVHDAFESMLQQQRNTVSELEALVQDYTRKLLMAKERLEALQSSRAQLDI